MRNSILTDVPRRALPVSSDSLNRCVIGPIIDGIVSRAGLPWTPGHFAESIDSAFVWMMEAGLFSDVRSGCINDELVVD